MLVLPKGRGFCFFSVFPDFAPVFIVFPPFLPCFLPFFLPQAHCGGQVLTQLLFVERAVVLLQAGCNDTFRFCFGLFSYLKLIVVAQVLTQLLLVEGAVMLTQEGCNGFRGSFHRT